MAFIPDPAVRSHYLQNQENANLVSLRNIPDGMFCTDVEKAIERLPGLPGDVIIYWPDYKREAGRGWCHLLGTKLSTKNFLKNRLPHDLQLKPGYKAVTAWVGKPIVFFARITNIVSRPVHSRARAKAARDMQTSTQAPPRPITKQTQLVYSEKYHALIARAIEILEIAGTVSEEQLSVAQWALPFANELSPLSKRAATFADNVTILLTEFVDFHQEAAGNDLAAVLTQAPTPDNNIEANRDETMNEVKGEGEEMPYFI
ncbi:hypothetical protein F4803DRAFT_572643 [Xylaria telfairii]|nr:hypothetical protein F4803DRAFT_572643 [Xylaria telfairii]